MEFLEELIKNAEAVKNQPEEKLFEISVKRFEEIGIKGKVKIKKPDSVLIASYVERGNNSDYLLSESIVDPNLSDKKLQTAYGIKGAKAKEDLLKKLFTPQERLDMDKCLSQIINKTKTVSLVDDIKN